MFLFKKKLSILINSSLLLSSYFMIAHIVPIFNIDTAHADFQRIPQNPCLEQYQKKYGTAQHDSAIIIPKNVACLNQKKT